MTDSLRDQIYAILDGGLSCGACGTPDWYVGQIMAVADAEQERYEESVVGALNERNTRDCARAEKAEAQVARIRAFLEDMAGWCSPHGVAADYAKRGLDALDGVDPLEAISAKTKEQP